MLFTVLLIFLSLICFPTSFDEFQEETRRQEIFREAQLNEANPQKFEQTPTILKKEASPEKTKDSINKTFINNISISGNTLLTPYEIYYITAPYKNRMLSSTDIFNLVLALQNTYFEKGFNTTRVSLGQNESKNNNLKLTVIEGKIGRIYTNKNHIIDRLRLWQLFPINNESTANDFDLRIGLNNIKRLSSLKVKTQLEPGFGYGKTNILTSISRVKSPWSMYTSFNGTSSNQLIPSFIQITGDHLLGIFDQWKLSYSHSIKSLQNSNSTNLSTTIPFKRHLFGASISYANNNVYNDSFQEGYEILDTINTKYSITDTWTIHYSNESSIKLKTSASFKKNLTKQDNIAIVSQNFRQSILGVQLTTFYQPLASFSGTIGFEKTMPWFNSTQDTAFTMKDAEHYEFEKLSLSGQFALSYQLPWIQQTATNITFSGQSINTITQSGEHAVLGGWYSVKGFNSKPQFGENYAVINSEQMIPISQYQQLPSYIKELNIQLKWFGDAGYITRKHDLPITTSGNTNGYAIGTGIGIGMNFLSGQLDLKIAKGLKSNVTIPDIESFWSWSTQF